MSTRILATFRCRRARAAVRAVRVPRPGHEQHDDAAALLTALLHPVHDFAPKHPARREGLRDPQRAVPHTGGGARRTRVRWKRPRRIAENAKTARKYIRFRKPRANSCGCVSANPSSFPRSVRCSLQKKLSCGTGTMPAAPRHRESPSSSAECNETCCPCRVRAVSVTCP